MFKHHLFPPLGGSDDRIPYAGLGWPVGAEFRLHWFLNEGLRNVWGGAFSNGLSYFLFMKRPWWSIDLIPMSATVRLQPVYSWKGVLKLFSCIAAHTSSKPKGNRNLFSLTYMLTRTTSSPGRDKPCRFLVHCIQCVNPSLSFVYIWRKSTHSRSWFS